MNRSSHRLAGTLAGTAFTLAASVSVAATPSLDEMWKMIQAQQRTIEQLQVRLEAAETRAAAATERAAAADRRTETAAAAIEAIGAAQASAAPAQASRTAMGGYGELHYNNLDNDGTGADVDQVDMHRFVLYVSHRFSETMRFFSELEVEHAVAGADADGEVEVEQAWVELDLAPSHHLRAGLDVLPLGIINTIHEPTTFYGVERNKVEAEIIPTTWWEAGIGANGELAPGWNYDVVLHSGLAVPTAGGSAFRPRSGRGKVSEATDRAAAVTARLRYTGIPGLELAVAGQYQSDITGTADAADIDATLLETHLDWRHESGFGLRALYARWDLGSDGAFRPEAVHAGTLEGWYVEPAFQFALPAGTLPGRAGVFARFSRWDAINGRGALGAGLDYRTYEQTALGVNFWPHENIVFKFDAQWEAADGTVSGEFDGVNVGVGYNF